jgi:hypothetical protein
MLSISMGGNCPMLGELVVGGSSNRIGVALLKKGSDG